MIQRTIFYSWQAYTEQSVNRYLIRDALKAAAKRLSTPCEVDEATRGVAGSPPIFETILRKIEQSAVFVGDVTIVTGSAERAICNPNVLIEYGYALAKLGESGLIPVLNSHFGAPERLPFDLRHRAVRAAYNLALDASRDKIKAAQKSLEGLLFSELRLLVEDPKSVFSLSESQSRIVQYISGASQRGTGRSYYSMEEISGGAGIEVEEVKMSVAELASRYYLERLKVSGTDSPPVKAAPSLFWDFDLYVHGWNPREDAKVIAQALVETSDVGRGQLATKQFASQEGWILRRLNPALRYLTTSSIVDASQEVDPDVVTLYIMENDITRAFLRGEFDPDARRRR